MINPAELPPEARLSMTQSARVEGGELQLQIQGTGWVPPDFQADWSQPVTIVPVGPVPGGWAQVSGLFDFAVETNLADQRVSWTLTSREAVPGDDYSQPDQESEITISLLNRGWAVLRTANGTALPMVAYSKREVAARGTGTPPVAAQPLTTITLAGVPILVTSYSHDTVAQTWQIAGEEQ